MPTSNIAISGYDLVQKIISQRKDDALTVLINEAGGGECDYLELKASIVARECDLNRGEKPTDMYWIIARELIAMANTRGGLLAIGISDEPDHHVVPLRENDLDGVIKKDGLEAYKREVVDAHVLPKNKCWTYKGSQYTLPESVNLANYVQIDSLPYNGEEVIVYIVRPCEDGEFISVRKTYSDGKDAPEELLRRKTGTIGECETLVKLDDIIEHIKTRKVTDLRLSAALDKMIRMDIGFAINNLPPRNCEFCGREKEIEQIAEAIDNRRIPILHGEGGTGKTELACEFAHRHRGRFAGGCIFLNMHSISSWSTALNALYSTPAIRQALGPIPQDTNNGTDKEHSRSGWIFKNLISCLARGNMLVILDNLDDDWPLTYGELRNGYLSEYLQGDRRVCIIGTTRVVKHVSNNDKNEIAQILRLGNLAPEDAVKLLCSKLPTELTSSEDNRNLLYEIVKKLGHNAWRTEIAGSYLTRNLSQLAKPPLETFLRTVLKSGADIASAQKTLRGNELSVDKLLSPTVESLMKTEGEDGKRALEMAKCIATFPQSGVMESPLRHIWKHIFKFPETHDGFDVFSNSMKLLEQYALIGTRRAGARIRMHQLTQEFFRRTPTPHAKNQSQFIDAVSKALANDHNLMPMYWAELAKDNLLMAHCPWDRLDGSTCHDILVNQPALASKRICWEKIDGYDAAEILAKEPCLAKWFRSLDVLYHDDGESPCKAFALLISERPDPFAKKCDFSRFNCRDVMYLLSRQPNLVKECLPAIKKFGNHEWSKLLSLQPHMFEYRPDLECLCPWDSFKDGDWARVIAANPSLANEEVFTGKKRTRSLSSFTPFKWAYLIANNPNAFLSNPSCPRDAIAKNARATVIILSKQPQLIQRRQSDKANAIPFQLDTIPPKLWVQMLVAQPQLARHCTSEIWDALNGNDWATLLESQPQFATKCDFRKFNGNDWGRLLEMQPQLARPEAWKLMEKEPHEEFYSPLVRVLYNHPELGEQQNHDLSSLSPAGKRMLLSRIPSLGEERHLVNVSQLPAREWARLVMAAPGFASECPFKCINPLELALIMQAQPQLSPTIRDQVPDKNFRTAMAISKDPLRVLMISDLFWHLDDARMTCNITKLIMVSANISWMYFILGLNPQSTSYLNLLKLCVKKNGGLIPRNSGYIISDPARIMPSLETMIDISKETSPDTDVPGEIKQKISIVIRRFAKSNSAKFYAKKLRDSIKRHNLAKRISIEDEGDLSSQRTRRAVERARKQGNRVALLNIQERNEVFFVDPKKSALVAKYHAGDRFFDPNSPDNLGFDKVVTISPLLFNDPTPDVGDRMLSAICR